ncbi:hypothetical protein ACGFI9_21875 [Micromonospora sp. NPDC048930]
MPSLADQVTAITALGTAIDGTPRRARRRRRPRRATVAPPAATGSAR